MTAGASKETCVTLGKETFRTQMPNYPFFARRKLIEAKADRVRALRGERGLGRREGPKAQSMKRARPTRGDRRGTGFRGIAKMLAETIDGIKTAEAAQQAVAGPFGDDRGSRDRRTGFVAFDERS